MVKLKIISALIFNSFCFLCGCSEEPIIRASIPASLGTSPSLYIGQRVKTFLSEVKCVEDNSDNYYCCDSAHGDFFNYMCFNYADPDSRYIKDISFQMTFSGNDLERSRNLESNAREVINILVHAYGEEYTVTDASLPIIDSLKSPKLIWENDSCTVTYTFVTESLYNKWKSVYGEVLNATNKLSIVSTETEWFSMPVQPSKLYSRESLGLNQSIK